MASVFVYLFLTCVSLFLLYCVAAPFLRRLRIVQRFVRRHAVDRIVDQVAKGAY